MTIKEITKNFVIPFRVLTKQGSFVIKGEFTLNRLDFGLGEDSIILSNDVVVFVELMLKHDRY